MSSRLWALRMTNEQQQRQKSLRVAGMGAYNETGTAGYGDGVLI
jgi:hypothetical protein